MSTPSLHALKSELPVLAQIESLTYTNKPPQGDLHFEIRESFSDPGGIAFVPADVATCPQCIQDSLRPAESPLRVRVYQLHRLRPTLFHHCGCTL
jgi:hydrogenase maturation factor HypF (carbamoyltransferase family)